MTWGYSCYSGGRSYHHGYSTPTHSYKHSNDYAFYGKSYHYSYGGYSHYSKNHCGDYQYGKSYGGGHHGYQQYTIITKYKHHDDWDDWDDWSDWDTKHGCYTPKPPKPDCPPEQPTPPQEPPKVEPPLPENGNQLLPPSYAGEDDQNSGFVNAFTEQSDINTYGPPVFDSLSRSVFNGTDQDDTLTGNPFANYIDGKDGNDHILGLESSDLLYGGKGNDRLEGGDGDDYLNGGEGNDTMLGGNGNDSYFVTDYNDIVIELNNIESGNDTVYATIDYTTPDNVENLYLLGNQSINATGNDLDNLLVGNAANNTLNGLAGNDKLYGGEGSDTYLFNAGYGQDVIYEYDSTNNDLDAIHFGKGIEADDLELTREGNNLVISMEDSQDKLIVNDWFAHSGYQIEELVFNDSKVSFSADQINTAFERYAANSNVTIDLDDLTPQTLSIC